MEPNDNDVLDATPVSRDAIGAGAGPAYVKPRWDPRGKRNMLIVGGVVLFAVALLVLLFAGGRKNEQKKASSIVEAPAEQPVAGGMLSQADRDALKAQENARIAAALSGGRSAVGTQVGPTPSQSPATQQPNVPAPQQGAVRLDQQQPPMSQAHAAPAAGPDEAKLHGLEQQMQRMMTAWGMGGADGGAQRSLSTYIREPSKASNAAAGQAGQQTNGTNMNQQRSPNDLMVVKAYEQPYAAEMMSGADSDTPGKLRARIMSGPLTGAVVMGTARRIGDQGFQADFTTASYNGRTIKIVAYGMDAEASGDVVRGNYDGRYMQRYVFPVVAEGVKAYAAARAQVATTVVAIPIAGTGSTGVVTGGTQVPTPTAEQARDAMYASGANQVSRALATGPQEGHVTLSPNTPIGIVFEESLYQSDLAGQSSRTGK